MKSNKGFTLLELLICVTMVSVVVVFLFKLINDVQNEKLNTPYIPEVYSMRNEIMNKIGNVIKRVSIKKGIRNSVHAEPISEFIHFLISNNMPRDMVINFLKYHYADGTTNGTGSVRMSASEYKKAHQSEIDEINGFINNDSFLRKCIDRFILRGRNSCDMVDVLIYGVPNDFIWIKAKDIYNILLHHKDDYSTGIHFSNLFYQPLNRCLNNNSKYEKCRFISQLKWYNIGDNIIENMNNNIINRKKLKNY